MGKCKQCKGRLEEDFISDYLTMSVDQRPCALCRGTGVIRTGPYRLADGTWSDGVDRTKRILYRQITSHYEITASHHGGGIVWQADRHMCGKSFETWAEAVAYADRMERTNQGENNE